MLRVRVCDSYWVYVGMYVCVFIYLLFGPFTRILGRQNVYAYSLISFLSALQCEALRMTSYIKRFCINYYKPQQRCLNHIRIALHLQLIMILGKKKWPLLQQQQRQQQK